ncbi:Flp pilus assembly protein TadD, contains TPR repeats [Desulfatibacillum alkenivorans DSM 16219]|jgi:tetratricopeptide (TPR) repeat protein|uniref:Flp pilus assembly protein TadD, contains TPR repeats n=1 Tax=Desulfatibacillum alkenivorans DSM 16219 TaxID=1121393 RepID=A0A1M6Z642_9BACT|nr:tetratricopeptide repeat protein [Desulfatibacillum alkenivorans]SHL25877.1 Flp pilus assembly protein TadD, contains TPR repeats [Desulfatibacillum alkenivorans DSM 16219]
MKTRFLLAWSFALAVILATGSVFPAWCQPNLEDMAIVRINDINEIFDIIDEWAAEANPGQAVTMPARAMMGGTDWIDPNRSAVAMVYMEGETPIVYGFIPFLRPSQNFQQMTQAQAGSDHYRIVYPPMGPMPGEVAAALEKESARKSKDSVFVRVPAKIYADQLEKNMAMMLDQAAMQSQGALSRQDMQEMMQGFLSLLNQLETMGMGVTLTRSKAAFSMEGKAIPGTQLAKALAAPPEGEARLANYKPDGPIQYRSRPYAVEPFMDMLAGSLGPFYKKLGVDFSCFDSIAREMTGEYAAGMSLDLDREEFILEGILCINDPAGGDVFISRMIQCSVDISKNNAQLANVPGGALYERTKDSKVAGLKVQGLKALVSQPDPATQKMRTNAMELRMASQDGFVFFANTDAKLQRVISKAKYLKPGKASGHFFTMDMDIGQFMEMAAKSDPSVKLPSGGLSVKMRATMDMGDGAMRMEMALDPNEIKSLASVFQGMAPGGPGRAMQGDVVMQPDDEMFQPDEAGSQYADAGEPAEPETDYAEPELTPEERLAREVAALVEKGNLSAMYGGPNAALKAYKKALELNPESPAAHFAAALAYAELKDYSLALKHTGKALEFSPDNPVYTYGKARILLLAGEEDAAMEAFVTAANSGSEDAQNYLDHLSMEP